MQTREVAPDLLFDAEMEQLAFEAARYHRVEGDGDVVAGETAVAAQPFISLKDLAQEMLDKSREALARAQGRTSWPQGAVARVTHGDAVHYITRTDEAFLKSQRDLVTPKVVESKSKQRRKSLQKRDAE